MRICFATNNQNKLSEVLALLPKSFQILSLKDIGCFDDLPETASTLEGNSYMKAHYVNSNYHISCFADDTGLEVHSLNNRPGVYSARYAGFPVDPQKNIEKLLSELKTKTDRKARFRTVITLILDNNTVSFEGIVNGNIIDKQRGTRGFGYDPVFVPDGYEITFAEMPLELKNKISHRGLAVRKLVSHLLKIS